MCSSNGGTITFSVPRCVSDLLAVRLSSCSNTLTVLSEGQPQLLHAKALWVTFNPSVASISTARQ